METSGAIPDIIIWPRPGDEAQGIDRQLDKAIEVLNKQIKEAPAPTKLIKASDPK